jgi:hypothetical protein
MYLFDLIRKLNDEITVMMSNGMPSNPVPLLMGVTDGYNIQVIFMETVVWDSTKWSFNESSSIPTDHEMQNEMNRVERAIKSNIQKVVAPLMGLGW